MTRHSHLSRRRNRRGGEGVRRKYRRHTVRSSSKRKSNVSKRGRKKVVRKARGGFPVLYIYKVLGNENRVITNSGNNEYRLCVSQEPVADAVAITLLNYVHEKSTQNGCYKVFGSGIYGGQTYMCIKTNDVVEYNGVTVFSNKKNQTNQASADCHSTDKTDDKTIDIYRIDKESTFSTRIVETTPQTTWLKDDQIPKAWKEMNVNGDLSTFLHYLNDERTADGCYKVFNSSGGTNGSVHPPLKIEGVKENSQVVKCNVIITESLYRGDEKTYEIINQDTKSATETKSANEWAEWPKDLRNLESNVVSAENLQESESAEKASVNN